MMKRLTHNQPLAEDGLRDATLQALRLWLLQARDLLLRVESEVVDYALTDDAQGLDV